jgi:rare lipoprotein A
MSRRGRALLICGLCLALAACAGESGPGSKPLPGTPASSGSFKVGNPYTIDGTWYYPVVDWNYDETGIASWYGPDFHGKATANGEPYDMNGLTAAHRTLPIPSIVQVTNLDNGRSIQLRINDRGPYARNRIIDVSRRAAQLLGFIGPGTAKVRVKILKGESIAAANAAGAHFDVAEAKTEATIEAAEPLEALPATPVSAETLPPPPDAQAAVAEQSVVQARSTNVALEAKPPPGKVVVLPVAPSRIYIQAGAFAKAENAERLKAQLGGLGHVNVVGAKVKGIEIYRVRLGPIDNVHDADQMLNRVVGKGANGARIVVD